MKKLLQLTETKFFPVAFIFLLTVFSIVVTPGYESFTSDQTVFLPPLFHELDSSLFPNGDLEPFRILHSERTHINDVLSFFVQNGVDLLWLLFILSILFRLLFFVVFYNIIRYFTDEPFMAMFILLFFVTGFFIPGTGHGTADNIFNYRTIATPLALLYLALSIRGQHFTSLLFLLLAFTIHPITSLPFLVFHYLHTTWETWQHRHLALRSILLFTIPIIVIGILLASQESGITNNIFLTIDNEWKQLANPRNTPAFFAFWDRNSYISLVGWIVLLGIPLLSLKKFLGDPVRLGDPEKRVRIVLLSVIVPLLMMLGAAFGEYTTLYSIVKINLQRGLLLFSLFAPVLVTMFSLWHAEHNREHVLKNGLLFAVLLWFLYKDNFVFLREQMLLFIPPLAVLFYGNALFIKEKTAWLSTATRLDARLAVGVFAFIDGAAVARSLFYHDITPLIVFHLILVGGFVLALVYKKTLVTSRTIATYAVITAFPLLIATPLLFIKTVTIYPHFFSNAPYMEACRWVEINTAKDSIFIVEPFVTDPPPEEFRLACFRPIFTTFKEGGVVPYDENRETAFNWKRRYDLIYAIKKDLTLIESAKRKYRLDYIFSESPLQLSHLYPLVFSNERYYIYDIR